MSEPVAAKENTKVEIPHMIQDPTIVAADRTTDHFQCRLEENYWNGPVSDRVAVLDFDHRSGELRKGVEYIPPVPGRTKMGKFKVPKHPDAGRKKIYLTDTDDFIQASVFGTVLRTMKLFEHDNALGHSVRWGFDGPQLLVIPRAGEWANAFYHRQSHSLQLFFFQPKPDSPELVYSCLSRDIVAHETGHAILDGIASDLYDALTPQSLALHEAVADLTAMLMAAESQKLVTSVLERTGGAMDDDSTAFSSIAAQFGAALDRSGKRRYLRQLANSKRLSDVPADEPHELSEPLTGALFAVLMKLHEQHRKEYVMDPKWAKYEDPWYSCSGAAFKAACFRLRNTIFQALEYLPPGEVSFADYGRAILAVDLGGQYQGDAADPGQLNPEYVREWLREEFLDRGIISGLDELAVRVNFADKGLGGFDLEALLTDDDLARSFAKENRDLLRIPAGADFEVRPRQLLDKTYYDIERQQTLARECLFKVVWRQHEKNLLVPAVPEPREVLFGTTCVLDLDRRRVRALLTSDRSDFQRQQRDLMFKRLWENGMLAAGEHALAPNGRPLESVVRLDARNGNLRLHGTAHLLHIVE